MVGLIVAAVLLFLILLLCTHVRVAIEFRYIGTEKKESVTVGIFGIRIPITRAFRKKTKNEEETCAPKQNKVTFHDVKKMFQRVYDAACYLKKKLTVNFFSVAIRMGMGDAADTGIAVGAAYAFLYQLLGMMDRQFILKKQAISIEPVYNGMGFDIEFKGTFSLRIWHLFGLIIKIRKEDAK